MLLLHKKAVEHVPVAMSNIKISGYYNFRIGQVALGQICPDSRTQPD